MGQEVSTTPEDEVIEQGLRYQGELINSLKLVSIVDLDFEVNQSLLRDFFAVRIDLVQVGDSTNYVYIIRYFDYNKKVVQRMEINFDRMTNIEVVY